MPVGDRQEFITRLVAGVLDQEPALNQKFHWLVNRHTPESLGEHYPLVERLFLELGGDVASAAGKGVRQLTPDAYFGPPHNFILEFDEVQHFSTARLQTLRVYPAGTKLGFDIEHYKQLCGLHSGQADKYWQAKQVAEFPHAGGRTKQRALFDCIRDLAAVQNGLGPTVRISEFDVAGLYQDNAAARDAVKTLLVQRGVKLEPGGVARVSPAT